MHVTSRIIIGSMETRFPPCCCSTPSDSVSVKMSKYDKKDSEKADEKMANFPLSENAKSIELHVLILL